MEEIEDIKCCICYDKNLAPSKDGKSNAIRQACCRALFCKSCYAEMVKKAAETPSRVRTCPMCRSPYPQRDEENFEGYKKACNVVGLRYNHRIHGKIQSYTKAFEYYFQAAELGLAGAQGSVGYMYENGQGVEKSLDKAFEWYIKAAENGSIESQAIVGVLYAEGKGVEQNSEKAFHYFTLAAKEDCKKAQLNLARCFEDGYGVEKNHVLAIFWYRQSMKDNPDEELCNHAKGKIQLLRDEFRWYL